MYSLPDACLLPGGLVNDGRLHLASFELYILPSQVWSPKQYPFVCFFHKNALKPYSSHIQLVLISREAADSNSQDYGYVTKSGELPQLHGLGKTAMSRKILAELKRQLEIFYHGDHILTKSE